MAVHIEVYFDGSSRGNPGRGTARWLIIVDGTRHTGMRKLGHVTNNEAEYQALIGALRDLAQCLREKRIVQADITIKGDSQLVINQVLGRWRVKNIRLAALWSESLRLIEALDKKVKFQWVPCSQNLVDPHK